MKTLLNIVLLLALATVAAAAPPGAFVAMRVDLAYLDGEDGQTRVRGTVTVAPEDRAQLGRRIWVSTALKHGQEAIARTSASADLNAGGQCDFAALWPPGEASLEVSVENSGGTARGVWMAVISVPQRSERIAPAPTATVTPSAPQPQPQFKGETKNTPAIDVGSSGPPIAKPGPLRDRHNVSFVLTDGSGRPAADTGDVPIALQVDGESVDVAKTLGPEAPMSIAFIVDPAITRSAMADDLRRHLRRIAHTGGPGSVFSAVRGTSAHDWTNNIDDILPFMFSDDTQSQIAAAVDTSFATFEGIGGRRLLMVLSGSEDSSTRRAWRHLEKRAANSGVPMLVLGISDSGFEQALRQRLRALAAAGGGRCDLVRDPGTFAIVSELHRALVSTLHAVEFTAPGSPVDVEITVGRDLEAHYSSEVP